MTNDHNEIQQALESVSGEAWEPLLGLGTPALKSPEALQNPWENPGLLPGVAATLKAFAEDTQDRAAVRVDQLKQLAADLFGLVPGKASDDPMAFGSALNGHTRSFCSELAKCSRAARDAFMGQAGTRYSTTQPVEAQVAHRKGMLNAVLWILAEADQGTDK